MQAKEIKLHRVCQLSENLGTGTAGCNIRHPDRALRLGPVRSGGMM